MASPRALIVDDERLLRDELRQQLRSVWPELNIAGLASNGIEALHLFERHRPEVVFLDIEMPGVNGLEVARQVGPFAHVVFVTAYDQHAIAAFEHGAIDYLLKPYDVGRLAMAVSRVRQRLGTRMPSLDLVIQTLTAARPAVDHLRWINASSGREIRVITIDEVLFFQSDSRYTRVMTRKGESLIRVTLRDLQDRLDSGTFWQIHRSTIVNANAIECVNRDLRGRYTVTLRHCSERLTVSEAYEQRFRLM